MRSFSRLEGFGSRAFHRCWEGREASFRARKSRKEGQGRKDKRGSNRSSLRRPREAFVVGTERPRIPRSKFLCLDLQLHGFLLGAGARWPRGGVEASYRLARSTRGETHPRPLLFRPPVPLRTTTLDSRCLAHPRSRRTLPTRSSASRPRTTRLRWTATRPLPRRRLSSINLRLLCCCDLSSSSSSTLRSLSTRSSSLIPPARCTTSRRTRRISSTSRLRLREAACSPSGRRRGWRVRPMV